MKPAQPGAGRNGHARLDHPDQRIALAADLGEGRSLGARKRNGQGHASSTIVLINFFLQPFITQVHNLLDPYFRVVCVDL